MLDRVNLKFVVYLLNGLSVWDTRCLYVCRLFVSDTHDHQLHEFSPDYVAVRIQLSIYSEGFCSTKKNTSGVNQVKNWRIVTSTLMYLGLCILSVLWFTRIWLFIVVVENDRPTFNVEWRLSKLEMVWETKPNPIGGMMDWMVEAIVLGFEISFHLLICKWIIAFHTLANPLSLSVWARRENKLSAFCRSTEKAEVACDFTDQWELRVKYECLKLRGGTVSCVDFELPTKTNHGQVKTYREAAPPCKPNYFEFLIL